MAINTTHEGARTLASAPRGRSRLCDLENALPSSPTPSAVVLEQEVPKDRSLEGTPCAFLLLVGVTGQLLNCPTCEH